MKLTVTDLYVTYGSGTPVVDGVDFTVPSGTWTCLLGPNGAGKSTVLRAIAGLLPATGNISIGDVDPRRLSARRRARSVAFVPQSPVIPRDMSVADYVMLGRTAFIPLLAGETRRDREVTHTILEQLDLARFASRALGTLSGGELQRVVLARALAQEAPLLLLDEPTTALDIGHQQEVLELVSTLIRDRELTVVAALHDLTLAAQYADRLTLLSGGRVVADGVPADVLTAGSVAELYGADVKVIEIDGRPVVVPVRRS